VGIRKGSFNGFSELFFLHTKIIPIIEAPRLKSVLRFFQCSIVQSRHIICGLLHRMRMHASYIHVHVHVHHTLIIILFSCSPPGLTMRMMVAL
jgi:hypothetical protein